MKEVNVFNAKTHFSSLVDQVYARHESIVITRRGVKVAQLIPFESGDKKNTAGVIKKLQSLSDEIGRTGISLKNIQQMKEEGRK